MYFKLNNIASTFDTILPFNILAKIYVFIVIIHFLQEFIIIVKMNLRKCTKNLRNSMKYKKMATIFNRSTSGKIEKC